eukprot:TRINITY_DN33501_c0_g1_i1.p1 TRINITY_DN33501_c0_g1~~TRINITY_DN33501_c0_g1_i1.p1  ORF type:complete len:560 (-),score=106.24 TRINITY_DN33501_c0_g1_i1:199-1878(-)
MHGSPVASPVGNLGSPTFGNLMEGGSKKRGMFSDASQDPAAKQARMQNPEFLAAFQQFGGSAGVINLQGLAHALHMVKGSAEAGTQHGLMNRPFQLSTCCWLIGRFGNGNGLNLQQWCELMDYLSNLKIMFSQVDTDHSGAIEFGELHRAFELSGVHMDPNVLLQVGKDYDSNGDGGLEFDEFIQLRLEWDYYLSAWDLKTRGAAHIAPQQLLEVMEEIKRSLEPMGTILSQQANIPVMTTHGIFHSGMFGAHRPFQISTCERLIIRFGQGNLYLTFEQFCSMMVFMKEMKTSFSSLDNNRTGSLDLQELHTAFTRAGMSMPPELVLQIGRHFDSDNSGGIEFDEFVQMATEWQQMFSMQSQFNGSTITAEQLRSLMGGVRVLYRVINGTVQTLRPFSLNTCRWLVAKFGTCMPGERYARRLNHTQFLYLVQYVRECNYTFMQCDQCRSGALDFQHVGMVLAAFGLNLSAQAIENILVSFDEDNSRQLTFDEFLQLLLEVQLYDQCFTAQERHPGILTPLNTLNPVMGQQMVQPGQGMVTLDRSTFLSMVFAVPRNLNE